MSQESKYSSDKNRGSSPLKPDLAELSMDDSLLRQLVEIVEANLDNEHFSVEDLANEVAISRSHLHRKLQKLQGKSISQFVRDIRLAHAFDLLKAEVGTVSEIAYRVGFSSNTYFIKCFSDKYGYSPGEVKRRVETEIVSSEILKPTEKEVSDKPSPLESLHPASSESLILEVFTEVANHKKSLQKFLLVDEEEGESVDGRLLAYQLIRAFPWPIGVELRRLFSASLRKAEAARYEQLNKSILRVLKLVAYILISDVVRFLKSEDIKPIAGLDEIVSKSLREVSPDNIKTLLEGLAKQINTTDTSLFVAEFNQCFDDVLFREMSDWIKDYHGEKVVSIAESCDSLEQVLLFMLKRFAFIAKYRMVHVGSIEVRKRLFDPKAKFDHKLHVLNSIDSEFKELNERSAEFSDSQSVLLMKSIKDTDDYLNLSPFVVDMHGAGSRTEDNRLVKRDIFLFDKFQNGKIEYYGSELNSYDDLSYLEHYNDLVTEYNEIINIFNDGE